MSLETDQEIPDPNGPPKVSEVTQAIVCRAATLGLTIIVGGALAFMVVASFPVRTMGALRSTRLKWQERQNEIARAQAESSGSPASTADLTDRAERPHD